MRDASLSRVGEEAVRAGVGWVLLNRSAPWVEALQREFRQLPIGLVGPDQVETGRLQGRQVRALLPSGGHILCVMGPAPSSAAQDRLAGLEESLRGSGVEISRVSGNWLDEVAEQAVGDWLRLVLQTRLRLGAVVCQNDAIVQPSSGGPAIEWVAKALRGGRVPPTVVLSVYSYPDVSALGPGRRASG